MPTPAIPPGRSSCVLAGRDSARATGRWVWRVARFSPAVTSMTAAVGALVRFQEGSDLLKELAGVEVQAKQVERTAEAQR